MLYLAKVSKHEETGELFLELLARQKSEHHWVVAPTQDSVTVPLNRTDYNLNTLVLADLARDRSIQSIEDATDWVLDIVKQYLVIGTAPEVLLNEAARAEEWRKELTLKTQDLARRALELETRRDQIQELENKLEAERQQLESVRSKESSEHRKNGHSVKEHDSSIEPPEQNDSTEEEHQPVDVAQP
jgi:hypothetical protein